MSPTDHALQHSSGGDPILMREEQTCLRSLVKYDKDQKALLSSGGWSRAKEDAQFVSGLSQVSALSVSSGLVINRLLTVVRIRENVPNLDQCGHSVAEMVRNSRIS